MTPELLRCQGPPWTLGPTIGVPESEWDARSACSDPDGAGPRLFFQRVEPEAHQASAVHLDITVAPPGPVEQIRPVLEAEATRLEALGGRRKRVIDRSGEFWIVMEDPEGNAFCLQ